MNFAPHPFAQRLKNELMTGNTIFTGKFLAHYDSLKMLTISSYAQMRSLHALRDAELNTFRCDHCYRYHVPIKKQFAGNSVLRQQGVHDTKDLHAMRAA